jgi:exodeoxyribonuclease V alpha subunit
MQRAWNEPLAAVLAAAGRGQAAVAQAAVAMPVGAGHETPAEEPHDSMELPRGILTRDPFGRLQLPRYADAWQRIAAAVNAHQQAFASLQAPSDTTMITEQLDRCMPPQEIIENGHTVFSNAGQRLAIAALVDAPVGVVTGGPGTGKTTTAAGLLIAIRAAMHASLSPDEVLIAAPTGKAARRLAESLQQAPAILSLTDEEIDFLTNLQPQTLHRALGWRDIPRERGGPFRYHADHPLPYRVLLIDESSMTDVELSLALWLALPPTARVFFLGDTDQLDAVEAGGMLQALLEAAQQKPLAPQVAGQLGKRLGMSADQVIALHEAGQPRSMRNRPVEQADQTQLHAIELPTQYAIGLQDSFRAKSSPWILQVANCFKPSRQPAEEKQETSFPEICAQYDENSIAWTTSTALIDEAVMAWTAFWEACSAATWDDLQRNCSHWLGAFQCLVATNQQVTEISEQAAAAAATWAAKLSQQLHQRQQQHQPVQPGMIHGTPIMLNANDHRRGLANGDVGVAISLSPDRDSTWRMMPEQPATHLYLPGLSEPIPLPLLPQHSLAYAMTIHKSQGSEWHHVAVLLPEERSGDRRPPAILNRHLLYTAVTRAKTRLTLAGAGWDSLVSYSD